MIPRLIPIIATLALAAPALAQERAQLRGEIRSVENGTISLQGADGASHEVAIAPDLRVIVYEKIDVRMVGPGDFLSIPSTDQDGLKVAASINVFPEEMRGTGEGERAWDLTEDSLMTNATVAEVIAAADGRVLIVEHDGVEEPIMVPEGTPITSFGPAPDRNLAPGDQTILFVQQSEDGTPVATLAGVSEDGSLPPL